MGSVSSGASDDLKRASELAINRVGSLALAQALLQREVLGGDELSGLLVVGEEPPARVANLA